jgi:hypothetical protein
LYASYKKTLYGRKQSHRAWFGKFNKVIQNFGMIRCDADHSVFFRRSSLSKVVILWYICIYDIVITSNDQEDIKDLKQHLFNHFLTKDFGLFCYFLWIEVAQSHEDIAISRRKHVLDILKEKDS